MATVSVEIKMDEELQRAATDMFEKLGLDFSTAIKIFLKRSVLANGIPFNMTLPKRNYKAERAVRAMQELSDASAINGVCNLTLDDINAEIIDVQGRLSPQNELLRRSRYKCTCVRAYTQRIRAGSSCHSRTRRKNYSACER